MDDGKLVLIKTNGKSIERREVSIEDAIAELVRTGLRNSPIMSQASEYEEE